MDENQFRGLELKNIYVKAPDQDILNHISLSIQEHEFLALIGPSGCGKSTLLKTVAGLLEAEEGEILLEGRSILSVPPEKRGTVIVFQDLRLFPHMNVEKNIAFSMALKGIPKEEQKARVKELLEAVQLPGFEKRKMREMSGGQKQRIALARALAAEPKVLLLDEPFSSLDEALRKEMGSLVKTLHEKWKLTTIMVTHDQEEAMRLSDRIALMKHGDILQMGTPQELFLSPKSKEVADYLGEANYFSGMVQNGRFCCRYGELDTKKPAGEYDLLVRPSEITLVKNEAGAEERITEVAFQGEIVEICVKTPDGPMKVKTGRKKWNASKLQLNDSVTILLDEDVSILYEKEF